jgi:hypothetical protein
MPVPKYDCQIRLTMERAVVGERRSTSHFAKVSRLRGAPSGSECRKAGVPGSNADRVAKISAFQDVVCR